VWISNGWKYGDEIAFEIMNQEEGSTIRTDMDAPLKFQLNWEANGEHQMCCGCCPVLLRAAVEDEQAASGKRKGMEYFNKIIIHRIRREFFPDA